MGVAHAEEMRLLRHALGEGGLTAGDVLGDHHGGVIGRMGDDGENQILERHRLALVEAELRGRLRGRVGGHGKALIERELAVLEPLERQIEGHHLGERGRVIDGVRLMHGQDLAGIGVEDDRGEMRIRPGAGSRETKPWRTPRPVSGKRNANFQACS